MPTPFLFLYTKARASLADRLRHRDDRGGGFVEYAAVIVLVAAIAAAVFASDLGNQIANSLVATITQILEGGGDGTGTGGRGLWPWSS
ncbi:hypothetical protein FOF52_11490 [Thermobifida alba]|uniref:Flp family type IVb pilin n=1 Tax=Thermobifida alba TaxID=53522 RepID=A0ABY4L1D4_THEAE|nr:hypothetical protein [Thermobifida alba]UPT21491.1 hypothetical protein FOF52_11490 [Thermobifida alba]